MRKIFTILMMAVALLSAGSGAEAKTTSKKQSQSKSKTTATQKPADVTVAVNDDGFPDPTGHTYTATVDGITMTITFDDRYSATGVVKSKKGKSVESLGWSQQFDSITMPGWSFNISTDGRGLRDYESGIIFYIVK